MASRETSITTQDFAEQFRPSRLAAKIYCIGDRGRTYKPSNNLTRRQAQLSLTARQREMLKRFIDPSSVGPKAIVVSEADGRCMIEFGDLEVAPRTGHAWAIEAAN